MLSLAVVAIAPSFVACSSPPGLQRPSSGVVLQGDATETQLSAFLQREPEAWAWAGGRFDTPDDRATLDASAPQTFSWHADPETSPRAKRLVTS